MANELIVLIEDNEKNRKAGARDVLTHQGYRVAEAESAPRRGPRPGRARAPRAHPDGHPPAGHRRHRGAAPPARGGRARANIPVIAVTRLGDDARPPEDPGRGPSTATSPSRSSVPAVPGRGARGRSNRAAGRRRERARAHPSSSTDTPQQTSSCWATCWPVARLHGAHGERRAPRRWEIIGREPPDLVLLDVMMPGMSGYDVCRKIVRTLPPATLPVVMVTRRSIRARERVKGIDAGADDFLTKPVNQAEGAGPAVALAASASRRCTTRSPRLKPQPRAARGRAGHAARAAGPASSASFSPALAEAIVSGGGDDPLASHPPRDHRGLRGPCEASRPSPRPPSPEEVMGRAAGVPRRHGPADHRGTRARSSASTGDGMMIFFKRSGWSCPTRRRGAVRMALAMRERVEALTARLGASAATSWTSGSAIAQGYATIGAIGFEGRWDYGAIGTVTKPGRASLRGGQAPARS